MKELIIRYGATEGPRNPTASDIREAIADIQSGANSRSEFTIENVDNWKPDVIDGRPVIRYLLEGQYIHAATFYHESSEEPIGWVIIFHDELKKGYVLRCGNRQQSELVEGICCGGPLTTRQDCIVAAQLALSVLTYFAECGDRSPNHEWLARAQAHPIG
jgi:hypothetical protein